jgi:hypothetical protein
MVSEVMQRYSIPAMIGLRNRGHPITGPGKLDAQSIKAGTHRRIHR